MDCSCRVVQPQNVRMTSTAARRADELAEETEAYEREYVDDHSWEQLQEDEHGRLRPLVRRQIST